MEATDRPELDFAIVGAQKSASTYLHRCLLGHPHVDIPPEESRNFEDPFYARDGIATLRTLFGPRDPNVRRGLKRPDHLADPLVPRRLASHAPELRILVVLRDPVERAVSAYFHYVLLGFLPWAPLDVGMQGVLDGSLARTHPRAADVLGYGMYGEHLSCYLEHFRREQILVLLQPDLRSSPQEQIATALRFVGVDPSHAGRLVAQTPASNRTTYDPRRIRVLSSRNRFMFDYAHDRYRRTPRRMTPLGRLTVASLTAADRWALARLDHSSMPSLRLDHRDRLERLYAADTERLTALIGRLPW